MKYLFVFFCSFVFAQQIQSVDFIKVEGDLTINPNEKSVSGTVQFEFDVLKAIDTIKIDAQKMSFNEVLLNNQKIPFHNNGKQLLLIYHFQKSKNLLRIDYKATPKQAMYFIEKQESTNFQIWTQGQGKFTSHWFPSFDDVNEKLIFSLKIVFDSKYQVISNGQLIDKIETNNNTKWHYKMQKPMSSYLLMLAVGKFDKKTNYSKSGIPIEMYIEPNDSAQFEPTYRYSKQIFDFFENEIGVNYPWEIYKQIPVRDFLYGGMENTSSTLFSKNYVVDNIGYVDRKYVNVNAHELAHQWFGNTITAASGKDHWLHEGFATYYALLAEKKLFGDDYFHFELYEYAKQIEQAAKTDTIPILHPKASTISYYQKGAWALHVLRDGIGENAFKKAIKNYLTKYAYQTVNTENFFDEIKKVSNYDLTKFSKVWLENNNYNKMDYSNLLIKNKSLKTLFEVEKLRHKPLNSKVDFFKKILQSNVYFEVKKAVFEQLTHEKYEDIKELLQLGLDTNNIPVRQAVSENLKSIPEDFRLKYETLLDDNSYQTQEIALLKLWQDFPKRQNEYLEKSKKRIGFNDYNLRILWLFLAITTKEYQEYSELYIDELKKYTTSEYEASTRKNALEKLLELTIIDDSVLIQLVNASTHHFWQFSKFAKEKIRFLLKKNEYRVRFQTIVSELNETEKQQLTRLLNE